MTSNYAYIFYGNYSAPFPEISEILTDKELKNVMGTALRVANVLVIWGRISALVAIV